MTLKEQLENSKNKRGEVVSKSQLKVLLSPIQKLQRTISDKWLYEYKKERLLKFKLIPMQRHSELLGKYKIKILEMTSINNKVIVLNPVFSDTDSNFLFEFYLLDYPFNKIIIKEHTNENEDGWIFYESLNPDNHYPFTKMELEKIIKNWL